MGGGCVAIFARRPPTDQRLAEMREMSEKYNCCIISLRADVSDIIHLTRISKDGSN
jgi:hypothetical protein